MKKVRAMKILCAVLTVMMVLGTGLSAMAAVEIGSAQVSYNANGGYTVTTVVEGANANEMVTFLVHDAASMYDVQATDIDYIDQRNGDGNAITFSYTSTGAWNENLKVYVGSETTTGPDSSEITVKNDPTVKVNGSDVAVEIANKDVANDTVIKTIPLADGVAATVSAVKLNDGAVDFFVIGNEIGFVTKVALTANDTIAITTGGNADLTGGVGIKLGSYSVSKNSFVAFGRVKGTTDCGIVLKNDAGEYLSDDIAFPAVGVSSDGGFAIEIVDDNTGADLAAELTAGGYTVNAYANTLDVETEPQAITQ